MTVRTLVAPMPEVTLVGGSEVRFEAISPTTGAAVAGVTVGTVAIYGRVVSADTTAIEDVVPLYSLDEG